MTTTPISVRSRWRRRHDLRPRRHGASSPSTALTCEIRGGAPIAVTGPSGSGKSTLLHLLAGLDEPTVGTVTWPALGDRSTLRPGPVAVVFQGPSLVPALDVLENVALPLLLAGADRRGRPRRRPSHALDRSSSTELARRGCPRSSPADRPSAWQWPGPWPVDPA